MTVITDEIFEARLITNAELAEFCNAARQFRKAGLKCFSDILVPIHVG
jgi:hypothetical protein